MLHFKHNLAGALIMCSVFIALVCFCFYLFFFLSYCWLLIILLKVFFFLHEIEIIC